MKNYVLGLLMLIAISTYGQEEKKEKPKYWRKLTTSSLSGMTLNGFYLQTLSVSVDYEINSKYSISSWTGANYNYSYDGGWISSSCTVNRKLGKFNVGAGMMYGSGNRYTPLPDAIMNKDISVILVVSKRFDINF